ncbi:type II toxin-antitoxin system Phd/YefM family antitoxin [Pseudomonas bohemica]|uniref:type II toxin-antitoxin system Phd/YefM family antitoxin n=1 Tax=Pseudomonas bohemica TaxID=2044872 RepID=UPI000DA61BAC|nr:type II toxin-antitoxin system prevent-host-death family antitoxin [Pseudomonas bohemica]
MHILTAREAEAHLDQVIDDVCRDHEPTAIVRRRGQPVVLLSLDDFNAMNETIYLLASPSNASRLRKSIVQVRAGLAASKPLNKSVR